VAHYLVTGHTGFKGAWLTFLLKARGHEVSGVALDPLPDSLFARANVASDLVHDVRVDIRNREATAEAFQQISPDYVIHLAAQALVREGYRRPVDTFETNVNGTLHVLEASDRTDSVKAQLIITTDKVYRDDGLDRPYVETDPLGGKDPYSASKAMADILAQEWLSRATSKPGAIARAGNVIGAGDSSPERLIPDIIRAVQSGRPLELRYPHAVRPWQHVFDCLNGYLMLLEATDGDGARGEWNFGPKLGNELSVTGLLELAADFIPQPFKIVSHASDSFSEAPKLVLGSEKAGEKLGWSNRVSLGRTVELSLAEGFGPVQELRAEVQSQIEEFESA
jgi:CDP-glucose 4,6-dehydratase